MLGWQVGLECFQRSRREVFIRKKMKFQVEYGRW